MIESPRVHGEPKDEHSLFLSREQSQRVDALAIDSGIAGIQLMCNAGRGFAELIDRLGFEGPFAIVCGKGNNGGDGFIIARELLKMGRKVRVLTVCPTDHLRGDARLAFAMLSEASIAAEVVDIHGISPFGPEETLIDAILGTGTRGNIADPYRTIIEWMNHSGALILAVDLPSGLDCDTGKPLGPTVRAAHTGTFVAKKLGFRRPASMEFTGVVHVIDIGVPKDLLTKVVEESRSARTSFGEEGP